MRNPPATRRLGRRARAAQAAQAAGSADAPLPLAPAPEARGPRPPKPGTIPPKEPEKKAESTPTRGMVCPQCGKYHDITRRPVASTFECKCGAELIVPPPREPPAMRPAEVTLRLRELQTRHTLSMISMLVAFGVCIALLSATLFLLVTERNYAGGICAGVAALAFLILAVVATNEWRRTSAELAAEKVDNRE